MVVHGNSSTKNNNPAYFWNMLFMVRRIDVNSKKLAYFWTEFHMMTSSNGNIFRVTGPLWGESTGHRWIPLTRGSDAGLWCFLWSAPEQTAEQTIETLVIWDAIALIMTSLSWNEYDVSISRQYRRNEYIYFIAMHT